MIETRLRKFNAENKELAQNLKKDLDAQRKPASSKSMTNSKVRKALGSELSSTRDSEERSSVPAMGRGQKRGRDNEIEKVGASLLLQNSEGVLPSAKRARIRSTKGRVYRELARPKSNAKKAKPPRQGITVDAQQATKLSRKAGAKMVTFTGMIKEPMVEPMVGPKAKQPGIGIRTRSIARPTATEPSKVEIAWSLGFYVKPEDCCYCDYCLGIEPEDPCQCNVCLNWD